MQKKHDLYYALLIASADHSMKGLEVFGMIEDEMNRRLFHFDDLDDLVTPIINHDYEIDRRLERVGEVFRLMEKDKMIRRPMYEPEEVEYSEEFKESVYELVGGSKEWKRRMKMLLDRNDYIIGRYIDDSRDTITNEQKKLIDPESDYMKRQEGLGELYKQWDKYWFKEED